jgi:hypothetical protein
MRDGLGDALDRMARREEVERLRAAAAAQGEHRGHAGHLGHLGSTMDEVTEAIRKIVEGHPGATVTVTVEEPGGGGSVRVSWVDGRVVVRDGPPPDAASRLAEMIRRDPTLLAPPD